MASGPITSWQIDEETVETVTDFIFLGSKITADGDCSCEIKTLAPWNKNYNQPRQHIKKQRHYFASLGSPLPTKVHQVKAMVFPVVTYRCESWTIKKAEHWRIDAFEVWCWRRLLRVPWTAKRSNLSILKETSPEFIGRTDVEAETLTLWPPDGKNWLIWKDPDAGKDWMWEKGAIKDEMVGWYHWLNGHEIE